MITIDGSEKSGSGTILRLAVALSAITLQPLNIRNIRQNRPKPGLRPQHLEAVLTAAKLCRAEVEGAELDSRELWFRPREIQGGEVEAEIGTAGSIPMLLITVLPLCAFAHDKVKLLISKGGTDVSHAPTVNYMRFVLLPVLRKMGLNVDLKVNKYGYYPKGNGEVTAIIEPAKRLDPLQLEHRGKVGIIKGVSVCTFLANRRVAERQAEAAKSYLKSKGYITDIKVVNDQSNPLQKGSSLVLWIETDEGAVIGADAIGELKKSSEQVGIEAAQKLHEEISTGATTDLHMADLLIPYLALAQDKSIFLTRTVTEHLETNIWLTEKILKAKFNIERKDGLYRVERISGPSAKTS